MRQAGAAATEMLIVLVPMLLVVLGIMQLAQLATAGLLVRYAAFAAARSAMVVLPEGDPLPENRPDEDPPPPDGTPGWVGGVAGVSDVGRAGEGWARSARYAAIARAAPYVTTAVSPPLGGAFGEVSVAAALDGEPLVPDVGGPIGLLGKVATKAAYAVAATATVIVDPRDPDRYLMSVPSRGEFGVRVTYLFACRMPLVNRVMCRKFADLPERPRREVEAVASWGRLAGHGGGYFVALVAEARMRSEGL